MTPSQLQFSSDLKEAVEFLSPILRPQDPSRLVLEYPLVFEGSERTGTRLLQVDGKIVSGAVFRIFDVKTDPEVSLKIGAIGSVGTDPNSRGKGYASEVLKECEKALTEQGCALALLWSASSPKLYENNGYVEMGSELDFAIAVQHALQSTMPSGIVVPFEKEKDLAQCHALYQAQSARVNRSLEEFAKLAQVPGMEIFVHRRLGKLTAYAAIGKGTDFVGMIHEWGGSPEGLFAIIRSYLLQHSRESVGLISSGARKDLVAHFQTHEITPIFGKLGMMKVLNPHLLLNAVEESLRSRFSVATRIEGETYVQRCNGQELSWTYGEFLRLLFGYRGVSGEGLKCAQSFAVPAFKDEIPFQLYFWGLDSV